MAAAQAATITVTTATDETASDGRISLREAIQSINAGSNQSDVTHTGTYGTNDTVVVPASASHYLLGAEIQITKPVTIQGAGASSAVIDAQSVSRVFHVTGGVGSSGTVTFQALTITGGKITGANGGGVLNDPGSGNLVFTAVAVTGNTVTASSLPTGGHGGGGIYNGGSSITLTNSTVSGNTVTADLNGAGGNGGGGISSLGSGGITLTNSTVSANKATANTNTAGANGGGGISNFSSGSVTLTNSTVSGNTVTANTNGAGGNGGGGISNFASGAIALTNSTVSGNTVTATANGAGANGGGGISNFSTGVYVNSTLSNNSIDVPAAPGNGGGALYQGGGAKLTSVTVAGNSTSAAPGGGLFASGATVTIKNSIVAQNTAGSGGANCDGSSPTYTSLGYNLEDTSNTCHFSTATDKITPSPGLEPLADNGGSTMTRALQPGSPAIDAIPRSSCTDQSPSPQALTTDQRGMARPDDGESTCDIGAYESREATSVTTRVTDAVTRARWSGSEHAGATAYDTAVIAGKNGVPPSGSLTYSLFSGISCSGPPISTQQVTLAADGTVPQSSPTAALGAGGYSYSAKYGGDGNYQPATAACEPFSVAPAAPALTDLKLNPGAFFAAPRGPSVTRIRYGTTVSYRDSQAATTTFTVLQSRPGVRRGRSCVAPPRRPGRHKLKRCKRSVAVGRFTHHDHAGLNRLRFSGRIRGHALSAGGYVLRASAAMGKLVGKPAQAGFRIKHKKRH